MVGVEDGPRPQGTSPDQNLLQKLIVGPLPLSKALGKDLPSVLLFINTSPSRRLSRVENTYSQESFVPQIEFEIRGVAMLMPSDCLGGISILS